MVKPIATGSDAIDRYLSDRDAARDPDSNASAEQVDRFCEAVDVLKNLFPEWMKVEIHFDIAQPDTRNLGGQIFRKGKSKSTGFYDVKRKADVLKFLENVDQIAISSEEVSDVSMLSIDWRVDNAL